MSNGLLSQSFINTPFWCLKIFITLNLKVKLSVNFSRKEDHMNAISVFDFLGNACQHFPFLRIVYKHIPLFFNVNRW